MPKKQPNIRWRKSDLDELQRITKNFNAKISRLEKKYPDRVDALPSRISKKYLQDEIVTRADYNRLKESLQKFTSLRHEGKLPDEGAPIQKTNWEIKYQNLRQEIANERSQERKKELSTRKKKQGGKPTDHPIVGMGKIRENEGREFKADLGKKKNTEEFERAVRNIDAKLNRETRESKREIMRKNYIKGLTESGLLDDPKYAKELEKYINGVSHQKFLDTVVEDEYASFMHYKDEALETEARKQSIMNAWRTAFEDEKNLKSEG